MNNLYIEKEKNFHLSYLDNKILIWFKINL